MVGQWRQAGVAWLVGGVAALAVDAAVAQPADLVFADGYEPPPVLTIPASAIAPWPALTWVDALSFATRSGPTTVWGSYWETSESLFEVRYVEQTQELGNAAGGGHASYANVDLGSGTDAIMLRVSLPLGGGSGTNTVEVRLGTPTGTLAGSCSVGSTGAAESYRTIGCAVDPAIARGVQTLVFRFVGPHTEMRFNWFAFYARDTTRRIDDLMKLQSTSFANRPAPTTPMAGTPSRRRNQLPAAGDSLAQSFGQWSPGRAWECPKWMHDTWWVRGDDGKVYPTWHPPVDFDPDTGRYCTYGHDHGDDPRGSDIFAFVGMPPFGYVNEQDSPGNPALRRREDHVGHKVFVGNNWNMYAAVGGAAAICDVVFKQHMGTHSPDALANTAHEVFAAGQCEGRQPFDVKHFALFGAPGRFKEAIADDCSQDVDSGIAPNPPTQPLGGIHRAIPTRDCYLRGAPATQRAEAMKRTIEFWLTGVVGGNLYTAVREPSRLYDPSFANRIGRTIDLCRDATHPLAPTLACQAAVAASTSPIAWDDPRSPFRGARPAGHHFSALRFADSATAVLYTNSYGQNARATPDPAQGITVRQRVPTSGFYFRVDGHASLFPDVDYSAGGRNGVRAPN